MERMSRNVSEIPFRGGGDENGMPYTTVNFQEFSCLLKGDNRYCTRRLIEVSCIPRKMFPSGLVNLDHFRLCPIRTFSL